MLMTNLLWISGGYFRTIMLSVTLRDFNPLVMLWKIRQYPFFHKETHNTLTLLSRWDLSLPFTFTVFSCHPSPPRCKRPSTSKPPHLSSLTSSLPPVLDLTQDPIKFNTTRQHRWTRNPVSSLLHQVELARIFLKHGRDFDLEGSSHIFLLDRVDHSVFNLMCDELNKYIH